MIVLGLNAYHGDSAAAIVVDGELIAAAEEERFTRVKHWAGLPEHAIRYCLEEAGVAISGVHRVAINGDSRAHLGRKLAYAVTRPRPGLLLSRWRNRRQRDTLQEKLEACFATSGLTFETVPIEHHRAHLGSAFLPSNFKSAVCVSVDGFGDFASAAWGLGKDDDVSVDGQIFFPHSLGIFYQAITQYLGFPNYGDEYKVMGLAAYGAPNFMDEMRHIVPVANDGSYRLNLRYFRHHRAAIAFQWQGGAPTFDAIYSRELSQLLGPITGADGGDEKRRRDLAASAQAMYEEAFFALLQAAHKRYRLDSLCLAGGCAMNSVANGKVAQRTGFRKVYVQPAAGDAGGAIGAALLGAPVHRNGARMRHAFWGPQWSSEAIGDLLMQSETGLADYRVERLAEDVLIAEVSASLEQGGVVGWFQGRMEWGPRALGHRSILADPRRADMRDLLNAKIKRRESFRPFAPAILREHVAAWFERDDDVPFMMKVLRIREERRAAIPAVTHVDGTGRLQTIEERDNPRYYRLIKHFGKQTGVPMLLNTSFNENEPIVCTPQQAIDCFVRTEMDALVLEDWLVSRTPT